MPEDEEARTLCPTCRGTGTTGHPCTVCHGTREVYGRPCWVCGLTGKQPCPTCKGTGSVRKADAPQAK